VCSFSNHNSKKQTAISLFLFALSIYSLFFKQLKTKNKTKNQSKQKTKKIWKKHQLGEVKKLQ